MRPALRIALVISLFVVSVGVVFWIVHDRGSLPVTDGRAVLGTFGGVSMHIEFALTEASREQGLSGRTSLPNDYGMLFVFPKDDRYAFWMKGMLVPLDLFWLDAKGQVVYMAEDVATSSYPHNVFYPSAPARYVLETSAGFGKTHGIATGTPLVLKKFPTVLQ